MILKSYVPLRSDRVVLRTAQRVFRGVAQPRNELGGRNLGASAQWEEEIGSCEHTFRTDDRGESARKVSERRSGVQSSQKRTDLTDCLYMSNYLILLLCPAELY